MIRMIIAGAAGQAGSITLHEINQKGEPFQGNNQRYTNCTDFLKRAFLKLICLVYAELNI